MGDGAIAVVAGGAASGAFDLFRQTNEFFYLCGVEVPHAYLRIAGGDGHTTLYLPHYDQKLARSEGEQLHCDLPEVVCRITGVDRVAPLNELARDSAAARKIFLPQAPAEGRQACRDTLRHQKQLAEADPWDRRPTRQESLAQQIAAAAQNAALHDLSPILDELRLIKSDSELAVMRRAGELTGRAVREAMRQTRPGLREYQLAAIADYVFAVGGASGCGYRAIVASGANIWNAHYFRNQDVLSAGDLVLMDYAPDVCCYTSDIGRMWPVSGRYSERQRALYGFIIAYHEVLIETIRPEATVEELAAEALARIRPSWESWPFAQPADRQSALEMISSEVAFTHPVGMAVHDVGDYRQHVLPPGLVFALDPQLWIREESLYMRVEDTVAVTATGVEVLTDAAPRDLDEVERLISTAGRQQGTRTVPLAADSPC